MQRGTCGDGRGKKVYYISLWPLILHRALHVIKMDEDMNLFPRDKTTSLSISRRRHSIVYYLLTNGFVAYDE